MTSAPRMTAGAHSAAYTGTVVDLGPMPKPRTRRATKRCCHELVTPCQMQAAKEMKAVTKMVPRRPSHWLSGWVSQHEMTPQQSYEWDVISTLEDEKGRGELT